MEQNFSKDNTVKDKKTTPLYIHIIKYIVLVIVLYFVYKAFDYNWDEIKSFKWSLNYWLLLLSITAHLITLGMFSKVWCILMKGFGFTVSFPHAFKISYIANLGRYLPGRIWPVFGMAYLAKKIGIDEQYSVTSWVVVQLFAIPSAFLVGIISLFFIDTFISVSLSSFLGISFYLFAGAITIVSFMLIFFPKFVFKLFNIFLVKIKREPINFSLPIKTALKLYLGYALCWIAYGFSFWLFIVSITGNYELPIIGAIGVFALAYQIGYLAIIMPGGIGVRELVLVTLLNPFFGAAAAGIAVAARIWNMLTEITAALIAWAIKLEK